VTYLWTLVWVVGAYVTVHMFLLSVVMQVSSSVLFSCRQCLSSCVVALGERRQRHEWLQLVMPSDVWTMCWSRNVSLIIKWSLTDMARTFTHVRYLCEWMVMIKNSRFVKFLMSWSDKAFESIERVEKCLKFWTNWLYSYNVVIDWSFLFIIEWICERTEYMHDNYKIEKITPKARQKTCNYIELFGSSARHRYARQRI